jgi:hypothetical protein
MLKKQIKTLVGRVSELERELERGRDAISRVIGESKYKGGVRSPGSMDRKEVDNFFVLLCILYIPSHEYNFLIDFILYLCLSGWFCISKEIDIVTHML